MFVIVDKEKLYYLQAVIVPKVWTAGTTLNTCWVEDVNEATLVEGLNDLSAAPVLYQTLKQSPERYSLLPAVVKTTRIVTILEN